MNLTGSLLNGAHLHVGTASDGPSVLNVQGDVAGNILYIGNSALGATGFVNQTAGTVALHNLQIGQHNAATLEDRTYGDYSLSGGRLFITNILYVGVNSNTIGVFRMSDGVMTAATMQVARDGNMQSNSAAYYLQSGGTATVGTLVFNRVPFSCAYLAVSGGVFTAGNISYFAQKDGATGVAYFGQGALVTVPSFNVTRGTNAAWTSVKFDGATLTPAAATATWFTNFNEATITANGVVFHVPSGRDSTIGQALANDGIDAGFLTKPAPAR